MIEEKAKVLLKKYLKKYPHELFAKANALINEAESQLTDAESALSDEEKNNLIGSKINENLRDLVRWNYSRITRKVNDLVKESKSRVNSWPATEYGVRVVGEEIERDYICNNSIFSKFYDKHLESEREELQLKIEKFERAGHVKCGYKHNKKKYESILNSYKEALNPIEKDIELSQKIKAKIAKVTIEDDTASNELKKSKGKKGGGFDACKSKKYDDCLSEIRLLSDIVFEEESPYKKMMEAFMEGKGLRELRLSATGFMKKVGRDKDVRELVGIELRLITFILISVNQNQLSDELPQEKLALISQPEVEKILEEIQQEKQDFISVCIHIGLYDPIPMLYEIRPDEIAENLGKKPSIRNNLIEYIRSHHVDLENDPLGFLSSNTVKVSVSGEDKKFTDKNTPVSLFKNQPSTGENEKSGAPPNSKSLAMN